MEDRSVCCTQVPAGNKASLRETSHESHVPSAEVLEAIENVILDVLKSLAQNRAPVLTLARRSDWRNIEQPFPTQSKQLESAVQELVKRENDFMFEMFLVDAQRGVYLRMLSVRKFKDSVGLQMIPHYTTKQVRSDCPRSAPKFALMLKILSMIYKMVQSNTYATKRDIYYSDILLFGSQSVVDNIINDISCMLRIPRRSLHVLSTTRGFVAGNLSYIEEDGTKVNCTCSATAVTVPSNVQGIKNLISHAKFMLIVEKDATFQRLLDDDFCNKLSPCIMITGRGIPDLNTRLLVRKLSDSFQIPIFTLMDADPHGVEIMCIYKYGSVSMSFEAHHLTVPSIKWLGLLPSDLQRLNIRKDALIPFTKQDQKKLASIQKRPYIACQPTWKKELEIMDASKLKAEIQVLTSLSSDYLSRVYLPNKLQFGGWV